MIYSRNVSFLILLGLLVVCINPNWNIKLIKFWTFLFCSKWSRFILKSPTNKIFLLISLSLKKMFLKWLWQTSMSPIEKIKNNIFRFIACYLIWDTLNCLTINTKIIPFFKRIWIFNKCSNTSTIFVFSILMRLIIAL